MHSALHNLYVKNSSICVTFPNLFCTQDVEDCFLQDQQDRENAKVEAVLITNNHFLS